MLGAIIGDISGSFRENDKAEKYPELGLIPTLSQLPAIKPGSQHRLGISDDTILSCATASALIAIDYRQAIPSMAHFADFFYEFGNKYLSIGGYGGGFKKWLNNDTKAPYNSCGNGSAMRVSPIGWFASTEEECIQLAFLNASATHNHPEGIKGAQSTALSIFYARNNLSWNNIKLELQDQYLSYEPIASLGRFDIICQDTMRLAWFCLDNTDNFYDALFTAVTIPHADSDTLGAIVGSIAEALYGIPDDIQKIGLSYLTKYPELNSTYECFQFLAEKRDVLNFNKIQCSLNI